MSKNSVAHEAAMVAAQQPGLHWCYHPRSQRAVDFLLAGVAQGYPQLKRAAEHLLRTGVIDKAGRALRVWSGGEWVKP